MQTWDEHAPNHSAFLRHMDAVRGHRYGRPGAHSSIYRTARRRGYLLALSLLANLILLAILFVGVHH